MGTLKHPACTVGWVVRLLQLAFPREGNPNFPWEKSHLDNAVVVHGETALVTPNAGKEYRRRKKSRSRKQCRHDEHILFLYLKK